MKNMIKFAVSAFVIFTASMIFTGCGDDAPSACTPAKVSGAWRCVCTDDEGERTANVDVNDQLCSGAPRPEDTCQLVGVNGDYCSLDCGGFGHINTFCGDSLPSGNDNGSCQAYLDNDGSCYLACEGVDKLEIACGGNNSSSGSGGNGGEICTDGYDNDNDGLVDCNDANCYGHSACSGGSTGSGGSGGGTCTPTDYQLCFINGDCYQNLCMMQTTSVPQEGRELFNGDYCQETVRCEAKNGSIGGTVAWGNNGSNYSNSQQFDVVPGTPLWIDFNAFGCSIVMGGAEGSFTVIPYGTSYALPPQSGSGDGQSQVPYRTFVSPDGGVAYTARFTNLSQLKGWIEVELRIYEPQLQLASN
ncbi:hypothetical protein KC725_05355 [Candidatus Peregrinibacteria bacterium]|nr:hypothetical protein [Candidatus Peregrinibacteria bacterium]